MSSMDELKEKIIRTLREVYDPEIPVNIYDLGLVYDISVDERRNVRIKMTLTALGCPLAGMMVFRVEEVLKERVPELEGVEVELVWDPPWSPERITREGREELKKIFGYDVVEEWLSRYRQSGGKTGSPT